MSSFPAKLDSGSLIRWVPLGMGWEQILRFSQHMRNVSIYACSIRQAAAKLRASECRNARRDLARLSTQCTYRLIYGYRAYGPYNPQDGHRFNPHKLLIDPYAGA